MQKLGGKHKRGARGSVEEEEPSTLKRANMAECQEEAGQFVDHLYVQFYNNYCQTGAGRRFTDTLKKWLEFSARTSPKGPLIFIGLPAASRAAASAQYYRPPDELNAMYQVGTSLKQVLG